MVDHGTRAGSGAGGGDEILDRAIDELRTLPPLDRDAVSRIVSAAARAREAGPAEDDILVESPRRSGGWMRWPAVAGIAAAAAFVGFMAGQWGRSAPGDAAAVVAGAPAQDTNALAATPDSITALLVANAERHALAPVPTQFVFESRVAQRVTIVGDFNGWNEKATPLVRLPGSSAWSVTVPLTPGRHIYAFMVDDTLLQTDPRAPVTRDPDFGVTGSVIIVGKP